MDHPIKTRKWWAAAFIRALKTFAQTVVALVGVDAIGIAQVDWVGILSAAALALVLSFLTSIGGLPEVSDDGTDDYQGKHVTPKVTPPKEWADDIQAETVKAEDIYIPYHVN